MRRDERQLLTFLALLPDGVAWGADERFAHPYAHRAGLVDLRMWPQVATFHPGRDIEGFWIGTQSGILSTLNPEEGAQWRTAVSRAQAEGSLLWTSAYHCAVGTKPT